MMARSHKVIGVAAGFSAAVFLGEGSPFWVYLIAMFAGGFGSLVPDIDHRQSKAGRAIPLLSWIVSSIFTHRGVTHSALIVAVMTWATYTYYPNVIIYAAIAGYASHIIADMFTKSGVMLAWPVKDRFGIPLIATNSRFEPMIAGWIAVTLAALPFTSEILGFISSTIMPLIHQTNII